MVMSVRPWKPPEKAITAERLVWSRDLDGVLDGLGTRTQEHRLLGEIARRQRIEPLGEPNVGLVGRNMKAGMGECLRLLRHGLHDARMTVSGIEDGDSGREIDETPAVDIP
jgi:hypothetical protein